MSYEEQDTCDMRRRIHCVMTSARARFGGSEKSSRAIYIFIYYTHTQRWEREEFKGAVGWDREEFESLGSLSVAACASSSSSALKAYIEGMDDSEDSDDEEAVSVTDEEEDASISKHRYALTTYFIYPSNLLYMYR